MFTDKHLTRMRQEFPELTQHYWQAKRLWSGSYFVGSVDGAPASVLRQHIEPCTPAHPGAATPDRRHSTRLTDDRARRA